MTTSTATPHNKREFKGLPKLRNIVAEAMFLVMFPGVAKLENICFGRKICVREAKMFLTAAKTFFVFRAAKFVSATHVSRAAKPLSCSFRWASHRVDNTHEKTLRSLGQSVHRMCGGFGKRR